MRWRRLSVEQTVALVVVTVAVGTLVVLGRIDGRRRAERQQLLYTATALKAEWSASVLRSRVHPAADAAGNYAEANRRYHLSVQRVALLRRVAAIDRSALANRRVAVGATAALPAAAVGSALVRRRRLARDRARIERRQCVGCGYDLRQSPERCPECGRPRDVPPPLPDLVG